MLKIKAEKANKYKEKLGKLKKYSDIFRRFITYITIVTCTPVTSTACGLNILSIIQNKTNPKRRTK